MFGIRQRIIRKYRELSTNTEGATAIEFALLALPFFSLLIAIMELAVIFWISSTLNHAVGEAARDIRTGNFQNCGQEKFKEAICANMGGLGDCTDLVRVDVITQPNFSAITLPVPPEPVRPAPTPADPDPDFVVEDGLYAEVGSGSPVVVRASYYFELILPTEITRLANMPGGIRVLSASSAFKTEPFPALACSS